MKRIIITVWVAITITTWKRTKANRKAFGERQVEVLRRPTAPNNAKQQVLCFLKGEKSLNEIG